MKNRSCILTLTAAAFFAATAANCLDTTPVLDARPEYMKLHAKAIDLARRHVEKLDGWKPQLVCFPGVRTIWQWDSCLMALFAGYTPSGLDGLGNLDNLYGMQADDGFMAMAYNYDTRQPQWRGRINPPLFAWCEWLYARRTGDTGRLPRAYAVCTRYFRWLKENRTRRNGLYWFEDTGSSGMDNSPRSGYWAYDLKGSDVCFVDLCCQQVLAAKCLAKIASVLGKAGESAEWTREAGELAMKINRLMWCGKTGFYHDVFVDTNNKLAVKTAAAFWSLVSGVADGGNAQTGDPKGIFLGLGAAVCYSVVVIMNKRIEGIDAYQKTIIQLLSAGIAMIPYLLATGGFDGIRLDAVSIGFLAVIGLVHTGIAYVLYFGSIDGMRAQSIAIFSYIDPVSALLFSALLLREPLSVSGVIGAVMIIGSAIASEVKAA